MREVGDLTLIFKGTWEFFMETCEITSEKDERSWTAGRRDKNEECMEWF